MITLGHDAPKRGSALFPTDLETAPFTPTGDIHAVNIASIPAVRWEKGHVMRKLLPGLVLFGAITLASPAWGQATTRICGAEETVGPACLLSRREFPSLPSGPLYWHLDRFASKEAAERAAITTSTVVEAFGSVWLFTIERQSWRPKGGKHVSNVGPLPVQPASIYAAEYLRSIFSPGMTAPLHVHSGPEDFYAISGDTCLETPDGIQLGRGPGNSLSLREGRPCC